MGKFEQARKPSLLAVDDDPLQRRAYRRMFGTSFEVVTARDGLHALNSVTWRLAKAATFDVVVSDVAMPRLGGRGLLDQLTLLAPEIARRFIFVTGTPDALRSLGRRADGKARPGDFAGPIFVKPVVAGELVRAAQAIAARRDWTADRAAGF